MYEPYHSPLTVHEVRGMMVYAIKQFRNPTFLLSPTNIRSNSFIWSTKPIREYLDSLQQEDKIFIVLTFKDWSYAVGNYYDETTLCRALLEYQPRKAESVMRNVDKNKRVLIPKTGSMNQPKSVHLPVFNLYESGKIML